MTRQKAAQAPQTYKSFASPPAATVRWQKLIPPYASPYKPFLLFTILACFPIQINPPNPKHPKSFLCKKNSPLGLQSKAVLLMAAVLVYDRRHLLHLDLLYMLYSGTLLLFVNVIVGLFVSSIGVVLGFDPQPPSNEPYLSTSLEDFWGKRWNLIVRDTMHHTVHSMLVSTPYAIPAGEGCRS
ncbi:hypothetical protein MLD38_000562 [Melastoma candidum]|uniref:Uncharacterized protein n=1 Tax=Melastoma candidum TaxID=119954 RepID=A0ACB9SCF8_9MYRT|nr:hypothetical protein MLD38_000562 [Melastoma candidum]